MNPVALLFSGLGLATLLGLAGLLPARLLPALPVPARSAVLFTRTLFLGLACLPLLALPLGLLPAGWLALPDAPAGLRIYLDNLLPLTGALPGTPQASVAADSAALLTVPALLWLWGAGSAALLTGLVRERLFFGRLARHALPVAPPSGSLPGTVRLAATAAPVGAFVQGLRRPRIVVPHRYLAADAAPELDAVLRHELAHIRRHDTLWLPVCRLLLCLAWPVLPLWWLHRMLREQTEMAVDELALQDAALARRRQYAAALLAAIKQDSAFQPRSLPAFGTQRKRRTLMRFTHIMVRCGQSSPRPRRLAALLAALLLLAPGIWIQAAAAGGGTPQFLAPLLQGWVSADYGPRQNPVTDRADHHNGIDLAAPAGTPVQAPADGTVLFSGERGAWGTVVELAHAKGYRSVYAHLQSSAVQAGQTVAAGETIARVGSSGKSTGPHLHFELYRDGTLLDPAGFLPLKEGKLTGNAVWLQLEIRRDGLALATPTIATRMHQTAVIELAGDPASGQAAGGTQPALRVSLTPRLLDADRVRLAVQANAETGERDLQASLDGDPVTLRATGTDGAVYTLAVRASREAPPGS